MAFANFFADNNFIEHKVGRAECFCLFIFFFGLCGSKNLTTETKKIIALHLNHKKLIKKAEEEEDFEMCKAIRDLINDGKMEGIEEGRKEGRAEGKVEGSILMCKKLGIDIETVIANIREEYHLSYPEEKKKIELNW